MRRLLAFGLSFALWAAVAGIAAADGGREGPAAQIGSLAYVATSPRGGATDAGSDVIGHVGFYEARHADTLLDIARRFDLGFVELRAANAGVDAWLPGEGTPLILPSAHVLPDAPRRGLVLNLAELRLYYFPADGGPVQTFPVGIGVEGANTPLGTTTIVSKRANPTWIPPASIRAERPELPAAVPPGPANPLGAFALDLGWPSYRIHGTNRPYAVGRRVTHGCVRLYPEDIERLYKVVPIGTPVTVVNQPVKLGWHGGELYIEFHPGLEQVDEIEATGRLAPETMPDIAGVILAAAGPQDSRIDWAAVRGAATSRTGVPVRITR
ncbi:MAG TPA: L,D-transpeptidase family protein [Dongiaceae bacterium]|nr:L,D-transpeptidase family protein [Dongiaceae bacterium]